MTTARRSPARAAAPPQAAARPRAKAAPALAVPGRWWKVALLVGLVLLGLPLAHAMLGEVAALLGGAVLFGFLLGRWTLPGR